MRPLCRLRLEESCIGDKNGDVPSVKSLLMVARTSCALHEEVNTQGRGEKMTPNRQTEQRAVNESHECKEAARASRGNIMRWSACERVA